MTFASDQNTNPRGLSKTSQRMLELREAVFAEWASILPISNHNDATFEINT